jgi:hypothetical protein
LRIHPKFILQFSELYFVFYGFLKFLRFSKNINEMGKNSLHRAGPASAHKPALLAQPTGHFGLVNPTDGAARARGR